MTRIALVVSDVDGTLLTKDKVLTERAAKAARQLREAGIAFTITSSRPAIGMGFLIAPLQIDLPVGPFNGSSIIDPAMRPLEQSLIPAGAAARCVDLLQQRGIDIWVFTSDAWLTRNAAGDYVPNEQRAIRVQRFGGSLDHPVADMNPDPPADGGTVFLPLVRHGVEARERLLPWVVGQHPVQPGVIAAPGLQRHGVRRRCRQAIEPQRHRGHRDALTFLCAARSTLP